MKKIRVLLIFMLFGLFFHSCQNEANWYPDAEVTITSHYEHTDILTQTKQLMTTCVIHNIGKTSINSGAVTIQVKTDTRDYLQTIAVNTKIIPGGKIAANVNIVYLDNTEQLQTNGVSVYASYFD